MTFTDENATLVGNQLGYVVVDGTLIEPEDDTPSFSEEEEVAVRSLSAIQPGFREFKNASLSISNGKYKSTMTLGRTLNGDSFAVKFYTSKRCFLWRKKATAGCSAYLNMYSSSNKHYGKVVCPAGCDIVILNIPSRSFGSNFNAKVTNFKSTKGNAVGQKTFTGIKAY